ncbi:glycoside hydrolase family 2 TIM barrel-domain containing protein [Paractinoplanes globisporus]|uniref:Glycoside hydrolase family 2 TIM barrel-domain containing protein n=1 Tax=Paractinoplanes globisporus TaxID=113565 RepID=A0ABW6WRN6_9ACTN|nr:glycoside hydrolase family 2 TIM barrel-domain containing protein [Actinoplanes globisporus]
MPGISRRRALQLAAGATVAAKLPAAGPVVPRRETSFDEGWLFARGEVAGGELPGLDDDGWRRLDLPHDWGIEDLPYAISDDGAVTADASVLTTQIPPAQPAPPAVIGPFDPAASTGGGSTGYTVGGIGWYRKHFDNPGSRVELRFDGVYQNADVWLNGVHLGFHPFGYTPFAFDVTPHLVSGTNVVAVRVDNSGQTSRWYSGSGIYRHTWLTVTGATRIPLSGLTVTTPVVTERRATVRVEIDLDGPPPDLVRVTLRDPWNHPVARREAAPGTPIDFSVDRPALWDTGHPHLYTAHAELLHHGRPGDATETTFGIRELTWDGQLRLNGRPVQVVGGCIHHDNGPMGAVALGRSEERRVELLQAAGFTALRTAHDPPSTALLDACDRLGMLVMDEFVDMWDTGKTPQDYSVHFAQWWERDLTSMIRRDRNHPSVVIWSLGNEITDNTGGVRGAQMAQLLRTLDATRPITLGGGSTFTADDPSWSYVDIGDVHYNANGKGYAQMHAAHPDKPMTHSEGFPATIHQDAVFVDANPWAVGTWIWAAMDYLGESGIGKTLMAPAGTAASIGDQSVMPGWSIARLLHHGWGGFGYPYPYFQGNCGDLDLIGQRKPQNHWRAAVTGVSPVELLVERPVEPGTEQVAVWWGYYDELESWTWNVPDGHPMVARVYTPGDHVRLLLDGEPVAEGVPERCAVALTAGYRPGELTAIASRQGREIGRRTLRTTGPAAAIRLVPDTRKLTTSRDDLAHVLVTIVDAHGRLVPDAVHRVEFAVRGAGTLAAVGNGNPHNADSFRRPRRHTWHGRALAILRPAKTPGVVTLTASAPGLRPSEISLPVRAKD